MLLLSKSPADLSTTGLLLRLAKPADPADQYIEDGLLHYLRALQQRRMVPAAVDQPSELSDSTSSFDVPHAEPEHSVRAVGRPASARRPATSEPAVSVARCVIRFLMHLLKGAAVGSGMYTMDYLLVNGQVQRLLAAAAEFLGLANSSPHDIVLVP